MTPTSQLKTKTKTKKNTKTKWLKDPTWAIFFKIILLKDIKYDDSVQIFGAAQRVMYQGCHPWGDAPGVMHRGWWRPDQTRQIKGKRGLSPKIGPAPASTLASPKTHSRAWFTLPVVPQGSLPLCLIEMHTCFDSLREVFSQIKWCTLCLIEMHRCFNIQIKPFPKLNCAHFAWLKCIEVLINKLNLFPNPKL